MKLWLWLRRFFGSGVGGPEFDDQGNFVGDAQKVDIADSTQVRESISSPRSKK